MTIHAWKVSLLHPFDRVQGLASAAGLDGMVGIVRVHSFLPNLRTRVTVLPCFYGTVVVSDFAKTIVRSRE